MTEHKVDFRIYYEDTDAGGIVYYANYLRFAERGRTEMLRSFGYDNQSLVDEAGILFIVRRVEADYLAPARLDDILTVETSVIELKNASFIVRQSIFCHEVLVCSMVVTLVCVTKDIKPIRMPDPLRDKLRFFEIGKERTS